MPPPRRPRDRLARALRAAADRLSGPAPAEDAPFSPGQPPEHWRLLVAAHAPGLLRDLPPSAPPPRSVEGRRRGRWRNWMARVIDGIAGSRNGPSRSWYERAPIGAVSYQDLLQVLESGTGISVGGEDTAGAETFPPAVDARCRSHDVVRPGGAGSREDAPACECVTSPGPAGSGCVADRSGSRDALGSSGTHGTPATSTSTSTSTSFTATADTGRATGAGTGSSDRNGTDRFNDTDSSAGIGTSAPTSADRRTGPDGSRDAIGSRGRVASGDPAQPSAPKRWPGRSPGRADALRNLAQVRRGRARHRDDDAGADLSPDRGDVLPLVFAAAPPSSQGPAARTREDRAGPANGHDGHGPVSGRGRTGPADGRGGAVDHYPAAHSPYPNGHDPATGDEFRTRQWQRPTRPPSGNPWPVLPDDAGPARTTSPAGAARATDGGAHADPWPVLPAEPAWLPTRTTPWGDTARLDREQAGD